MENRRRIALALAKGRRRDELSEGFQRDDNELANARSLHEAQVQGARLARAGRSAARRRWGQPPA